MAAIRRMSESDKKSVAVWDGPTRVFHWLIVALIPAAYATARPNWMEWHARVGYALLVALLFRLLWGVLGGQTARFANFLASPGAALRHLKHLFRPESDRQVGHNPAGGWMVIALIGLMLGQSLTGLYVANDIADDGPLTERVPAAVATFIEDAHDILLWRALEAAIVLHLAAILAYAAFNGQNLVLPMLTGRKLLAARTPAPSMASGRRALLLLACAAAAAAALVHFL